MIEGYLEKTSSGRYAIDGLAIHELTSGDCIEVFKDGVWEQTRVEFSHKDKEYYLVNDCPIDGTRARM